MGEMLHKTGSYVPFHADTAVQTTYHARDCWMVVNVTSNFLRNLLAVPALVVLASGCASTQRAGLPAEQDAAKVACGSFLIYDMCMIDRAGDRRVDYAYFADDMQIFLYQQDEPLPAEMALHPCAMAMTEDVVLHSSELLYSDDLTLLEEMDVKRKLLVSYMAARNGVADCNADDEGSAVAGAGFDSDEYDWGDE